MRVGHRAAIAAGICITAASAGGDALAQAPCRPAGAQVLDADRSQGTLYATGQRPRRTLVACRSTRSRPVRVFRESPARRILRARADRNDGVLVTARGAGQSIAGFHLGDGRRLFARTAPSIASEQADRGRIAWAEGRGERTELRLFSRNRIVVLDSGSDLGSLRLTARAARWTVGSATFWHDTQGRDPCRPPRSADGPATADVRVFSYELRNEDADEPIQELYACKLATGRSIQLFRAVPQGLGYERAAAMQIAGSFVLFGYSGGNQYGGGRGIGIGNVDTGQSAISHTISSYTGEPFRDFAGATINDLGDLAFVTVEYGYDGTYRTTALVADDPAGRRELDTGPGISNLAIDRTTVSWTKDGVPMSAALRR